MEETKEHKNAEDTEKYLDQFEEKGLGLAKTYWIFGVVGNIFMGLIARLMIVSGMDIHGVLIITSIYSIAVWIAVWISANNYKGPKIWAFLAKLSVVLGILGTIGQLGLINEH
jgi:hypothetical protein